MIIGNVKLNRGDLLQRKFPPILVKLNRSMRDGFIRLDADRIEAVSVLRIRRVIKRLFNFPGKILAYLHGNRHLHLPVVQDCRALQAASRAVHPDVCDSVIFVSLHPDVRRKMLVRLPVVGRIKVRAVQGKMICTAQLVIADITASGGSSIADRDADERIPFDFRLRLNAGVRMSRISVKPVSKQELSAGGNRAGKKKLLSEYNKAVLSRYADFRGKAVIRNDEANNSRIFHVKRCKAHRAAGVRSIFAFPARFRMHQKRRDIFLRQLYFKSGLRNAGNGIRCDKPVFLMKLIRISVERSVQLERK